VQQDVQRLLQPLQLRAAGNRPGHTPPLPRSLVRAMYAIIFMLVISATPYLCYTPLSPQSPFWFSCMLKMNL
jgi:hypothetical protein